MHQRILLAPVSALTAAMLFACGGTGDDPGAAPTPTATSGPATVTAGPHNTIDIEFAQMMIPHHQQAVQMADLAAGRAADPRVTQLAAAIRAAQQPEIATMTGWLTSWAQPTTMPGMPSGHSGHDMGGGAMPGMMSEADMTTLEALSGTEFDRSFLTLMVAHHNGAVDMARSEQREGRYPPALALARSIQAGQTAEIRVMKQILGSL